MAPFSPVVATLVLAAAVAPATTPPVATYKIFTAEPGVVRVDWEALQTAGLEGAVPVAALRMENRGRVVPLHVSDGGDGSFGPGDWLELLAAHLPGERSYYNEETPLNVYLLRVGPAPASPAATQPAAVPSTPVAGRGQGLWVDRHLEHDRLLLRFSVRPGEEPPEPWYWAKLTHLDAEPFSAEIDLADWDFGRPISLRLELRGWSIPSKKSGDLADHRVEVLWNDVPVGVGEWQRQDAHTIEIASLPAEAIRRGRNTLRLVVPKRLPADAKDPLIDVSLLNWVELAYGASRVLVRPQTPFEVEVASDTDRLELITPRGVPVALYGDDGLFRGPTDAEQVADGANVRHRFALPPGVHRLHAVRGDGFLEPVTVERDTPSSLLARAEAADYLMIVHPTLAAAAEPLAEFHRRRGLAVAMVDVEDIYDELSHGVVSVHAIRDFIAHAYHHWPKPAPRFVLLVGDASWDAHNAEANDANYADWTYQPGERLRFVKNGSTPYANRMAPGERNLIPTWPYQSYQGHAASDNWLVAVDGEDVIPELAVGRFPVVEPAEVEAIVRKTIRYVERAEVGPWRRRILWITNDEKGFQQRSEDLVGQLAEHGYEPLRVYPQPDEPSNAEHQEFLRAAFDAGQLLVHFYGHGGRYIWRTAAPDYKKNNDLFTLEDLDQLQPTDNYPVVLSMTCYTSPFDHPTADSIGEKFLRLADRGAVGVIGASWRSSPSPKFSQALLEALVRPGSTVGEALREAKEAIKSGHLVEMYNLLGDPAVPLAIPQLPLEFERQADGPLLATVPAADFTGRAVIDWLNASGEPLASAEIEVAASQFEVLLADAPAEAARVQVYAWNHERRQDAIGTYELPRPEPEPAMVAAAAAAADAGQEQSAEDEKQKAAAAARPVTPAATDAGL